MKYYKAVYKEITKEQFEKLKTKSKGELITDLFTKEEVLQEYKPQGKITIGYSDLEDPTIRWQE